MNRDKTENLIPFKPGQSGNPSGRPKGSKDRKKVLEELLEMVGGQVDGQDKTNFEIIAAQWITKAKKVVIKQ